MEKWSYVTVRLTFGKQQANFAHCCGVELGHAMSLAVRVALFDDHIGVVVPIRSKEKMGGLYAGWSVTGMKHAHAFRDRSIRKLPSKAMRVPPLQVTIGEDAIAVAIGNTKPEPAVAGLVSEGVEALVFRDLPVSVGA